MSESPIESKSIDLAVRIINLCKYLNSEKNEYTLSKELLLAGTGIGAYIAESQRSQSRTDFLSSMNNALKKAADTLYWIKLLNKTEYLTQQQFTDFENDITDINKLLISICSTASRGN